MTSALILFPHQLFRQNVTLARDKQVYFVEHPLYFRQYRFHCHKLILHRASMRAHEAYLAEHRIPTHYYDSASLQDLGDVLKDMQTRGVDTIHYLDPVDDWLERDVVNTASTYKIPVTRHETPMFIARQNDLQPLLGSRKRYSMATFYAAHRKQHKILMQGNSPVGGRWSFDTENRKRLPKSLTLPSPWRPAVNAFVTEARDYVARHFPDNPGDVEQFNFAVTPEDAKRWLEDFLEHRFASFGPYEDAIASTESVLFHSNISHLLNIGLLTPDYLLNRVIEYARDAEIALNSLEGYVRQVLGWREYMRAAYVLRGRQMRSRNFWQHQRSLPEAFYTGDTGILPVDTVIKRVVRFAYAHHIERLMILANFMQLCEINPDDVYQWFMEFFIDAYDWVMVPNVYAMALYADGGTMTQS